MKGCLLEGEQRRITMCLRGEGSSDQSPRAKKILRCFICHKEGHFKRNCPLRKGKNYESDNGSTADASIVKEGY